MEKNLHDLAFRIGFLNMTPKAQTTKERTIIDKLDFIKIKNLFASKDTVKRVKRQPIGWEKMFAKQIRV